MERIDSLGQPPSSGFVPGWGNAYWFSIFNALSYQMVLGSPIVLYAKSLGASATVLGIIAGMMPLLVIFQIPAARHIARVGYKRFVFAGWGTRVMFIFLVALVPLTEPFLNAASTTALLVFLLFCFNLSRGISSAAWLPWITALVPGELRGKYLARDSACVNGGSFLTLMAAGLALGPAPQGWRFSVIFAYSALMGMVSLRFLKRIPDAPHPAAENNNPTPVPWFEIAAYPPFRKLLFMNVAWALAYGGLGAFTVAYLKATAGMNENRILFVTAISYLGGMGGLVLFGTRLDRHGSKPILTVTMFGWALVMAVWAAMAGGLVHPGWFQVLGLELCMGLGWAVFTMANTRLAMVISPPMGRDHFFALFSVVSNLTLGIAPICWGLLIDAIGPHQWSLGNFTLMRFSVFFLLVTLIYLVTGVICRRLDEPRAANIQALLNDLLAKTPLRSWMRFWPRG